jgi:aquaporin Z
VFSSGWALEQLWVFLAAPLLGAAIAGLVFRSMGTAGAGTGAVVQAGTGETTEAGEPAETAEPGSREAQEFFDGKRG